MNIEQSIEELKLFINSIRSDLEEDAEDNFRTVKAIETLLTAYENQQKEIQDLIINQCIYQDTSSCTRSISLKMYTELNNYISKDKIKPIQIIDLDGKIHNVYKIEEE